MNISTEALSTLVDEIARLKARVQEQHAEIERLKSERGIEVERLTSRIDRLLQDNADLRDALQLVERIFGE